MAWSGRGSVGKEFERKMEMFYIRNVVVATQIYTFFKKQSDLELEMGVLNILKFSLWYKIHNIKFTS